MGDGRIMFELKREETSYNTSHFSYMSRIEVRREKKHPTGIERYRIRRWVDDTK